MTRITRCYIGLCWLGLFAGAAHAATEKLTGWFACEKCTASRVAKGDVRPSNPACSKQCIEAGSETVFLSEQGKAAFKVKKYTAAKDDLGYHLEVTGEIDPVSKTIYIDSQATVL